MCSFWVHQLKFFCLGKSQSSFITIHLEIADHKCEIYSPTPLSSQISSQTTVPINYGGSTILGIPIGKVQFIQEYCVETAKSVDNLCKQLTELDDIQSAMLLLRFCHIPRINHLARSVTPELLKAAADLHDFQSRSTFTTLLGCNSIDDTVWHQATQPIKYGGFGMSSVQSVASSAFLALWAHSLNELPIRFPDIKPEIDKVVMSTPSFSCLGQTLNSIVPPSQSLLEMLSESKRLQHKLSKEKAKIEAICLIENATSLRDDARLRSLQGKSAGSWLSAIPTSGKLALKPSEFRLAAYLRLGLLLPLCDNIQTCDCGQATGDSSGHHQITCK